MHVPVFLVTSKDSDGEESLDVLPDEGVVDLWAKVWGLEVIVVAEMTAQIARNHMYQKEDGTPDTSVSPTAVVEEASENKERLLHFVGSLMDWVARGERAKEQLKGLKIEKKWTDESWEYMWKGAAGQKVPEI